MRPIFPRPEAATTSKRKISMKTALLAPLSILLAVASVMPSEARPHNDRTSVYNRITTSDISRKDSSCFNLTGLPDLYACGGGGN